MILFSGNTYKHKDTIKALGAKWNKPLKRWELDGDLDRETLPYMNGVTIETIDGEEIADFRSHKEKYGRCEDAPCCGCCGQHPYYGGDSW